MLASMFQEIFDITHEEADFVCYAHAWNEYNEPMLECLEDWNEAMRRFNKLIAHYEFLGGKAPEPEQ